MRRKGGLLVEAMGRGFPRLAEFIAIFAIKIIGVFLKFKSFTYDVRGVIRASHWLGQNTRSIEL